MPNITVELPYVLLDPGKIRKSYEDTRGNEHTVCGFGSYPCDLNGGRNFRGKDNFDADHLSFIGGKTVAEYITEGNDDWRGKTQNIIKAKTKRLNALGVPIFATMTNICPNSQDNFKEAFDYLDLLAESDIGNGAVLANNEYAKAVMERYGSKLKYVCSVIRHVDDPKNYPHLFRKYDMVVIRTEDAVTPGGIIDENFFNKLGPECRERSVVIVNQRCQRDCTSARDHYRRLSELAKSFELHSGISGEKIICRQNMEMILDRADIDQLADMGVPNFKVGRNMDPALTSSELFPSVAVFK